MIVSFRKKRLAAGNKPRTVNLDLIMLRNVLRRALDAGHIRKLPTEGIKSFKCKSPRRDVLEPSQVSRLLDGDETALAAQKPTRAETLEKDHGRIETRRAVALAATALFGGIRGLAAWAGVQSVAMVEARREPAGGGAASVERRYFLSSLPPDAARLLQVARGHWAIENHLHWMLDVHFDEDRCRVRKDHAPLNLATVRRVALSLAKRDTRSKTSVRLRLKRAGWDDAYLLRLLNI